MNTIEKTLIASALSLVTSAAAADTQNFWTDSAGNYVRDSGGDCVHSSTWQPGDECGGSAESMKSVAPAAETRSESTARAEPAPQVIIIPAPAPKYSQVDAESGTTFELGGSSLSPSGKAAVANMVAKFKGEGEIINQIIVEGHTDAMGAATFNQALSEKRAQAVRAELIDNGVMPKIIEVVGHGESKPVASNKSRDGRAQNRRVEIKLFAVKREF